MRPDSPASPLIPPSCGSSPPPFRPKQSLSHPLPSGPTDTFALLSLRRTATPQRNYAHHAPVNDLALHSNQGELISCDQNGAIKVWDLGGDRCSHELVRLALSSHVWARALGGLERRPRRRPTYAKQSVIADA